MTQSVLSRHGYSTPTVWTARVLGAVTVLFLLFDAVGKFMKPQPVVDAFARIGVPLALAPEIGTILLALVVLYVIPQTRALGAVLLTGYLGGAVAINLRAGDSAFETLFPVIIGVIAWAPLYLLDERVRAFYGAHR